MGQKLRNYILKLYSLETKIFSEEDIECDLVKSLKNAQQTPEFLRNMEKIERYLLIKTILETVAKKNHEIFNQSFPLGYLNPEVLVTINSPEEFFQKLTKNYSKAGDVALNFSYPFNVDEITKRIKKKDSHPITAALFGSYSHEPDRKLRLQLLKLLAQDFRSMGEYISLGRVKLIHPYLPDLMQKSSPIRYNFLRMILNRTYPFTEENKYDSEGYDNWASEIKSA